VNTLNEAVRLPGRYQRTYLAEFRLPDRDQRRRRRFPRVRHAVVDRSHVARRLPAGRRLQDAPRLPPPRTDAAPRAPPLWTVACKTLSYTTQVTSFLGVWYVVGFTVERFVAVQFPLRRRSLCTAVKARRTVVGLAAFAGAAHGYVAWTSGVTEPWPGGGRLCGPLRRYAGALSLVLVVDTCVTLLLPFVVISLVNVRIVVAVVRQNGARRALAGHVPPPSRTPAAVRRCSAVAGRERPPLRRRYVRVGPRRSPHFQYRVTKRGDVSLSLRKTPPRTFRGCHTPTVETETNAETAENCSRRRIAPDQYRVTRLLLTVSLAFLALNLPRHASRLYALIDRHYRPSTTFLAVEKLFSVAYYAQFAVNIVLYATLGGRKFRSALRRRCRAFCRFRAAA